MLCGVSHTPQPQPQCSPFLDPCLCSPISPSHEPRRVSDSGRLDLLRMGGRAQHRANGLTGIWLAGTAVSLENEMLLIEITNRSI